MLERLCGQALAKRILSAAAASGRVAHAYLFAGPDGTGKSLAAEDLASTVLGSPAQGHPDYHVVAPERQRFLRDQAREIRRLAALLPYAGQRSVFVLKRAEALTGEAAATLLKLVEEPPAGAVFILLCEHTAQLEGTIRSRCQVVPFTAVPPGELAAWLAARGVAAPEELVAVAGGIPGEALRLAEDGEWRLRLQRAVRLAAEVGAGDLGDELKRAAEASEDEGLLPAFAQALRSQLAEGAAGAVPAAWPLAALEAWFDAESALAANVTRRLTWEVLLLRLRRARGVGYDAIKQRVGLRWQPPAVADGDGGAAV